MALILHAHPLSAYCWKVLIALHEMGIAFEQRLANLGDPQEREAFHALWPTGKIPLLVDGERVVPETSIQVEYLARHHAPAGHEFFPADPEAQLEVRLMDRLSDCYVMTPMQAIVGDRLRPETGRDPVGVANARATLAMAYGLLERRLAGRTWMAGDAFGLADCAAGPALFYATTLVPLPADCARLGAYVERVLQRPSVVRVIDEARPFFQFYPYREALPERYAPAG